MQLPPLQPQPMARAVRSAALPARLSGKSRDEPGRGIGRERRTNDTRAERTDPRADLMASHNPAERDRRVTHPDGLGGEAHRGRNGGDPIEANNPRVERRG